jgi:hypothetical protein
MQIVGIAPRSLTGLEIVMSIMSKNRLLCFFLRLIFFQIPSIEKRHSHQNKKKLAGTSALDP